MLSVEDKKKRKALRKKLARTSMSVKDRAQNQSQNRARKQIASENMSFKDRAQKNKKKRDNWANMNSKDRAQKIRRSVTIGLIWIQKINPESWKRRPKERRCGKLRWVSKIELETNCRIELKSILQATIWVPKIELKIIRESVTIGLIWVQKINPETWKRRPKERRYGKLGLLGRNTRR